MGSKTVRIVIIIALVVGIAAIIGITALVVATAKSSEPRVIDLNENTQANEYLDIDEEKQEKDMEEQEDESSEESDSSNDTSEDITENMQKATIEAFNSKFLSYEGNQKGSHINALLQIIRDNNESNPDTQVKALANVQNWDKENNKALADKYYKVYFDKDEETGRINAVKIEDAD